MRLVPRRLQVAMLAAVVALVTSGLGAAPAGGEAGEADVYRQTLPNGLRVVVRERPSTDVVALSVGIRGGSRDEDAATVGAAHFMEHMFFQGTQRRPNSLDIDREIEALGGWTNAWTGWESINFQVVVPREGFELALDVLSDMMTNSVFAEDKVDKERRVVLEELNRRLSTPSQRASDLFFVEVFGDHPARNLPIGNRQTVNATDRNVLLRFRDRFFVAGNMVVAAVGDVDHRAVIPRIAAAFEPLRPGSGPPTQPSPEPTRQQRRVTGSSGGQQARIMMGGIVPGGDSPDRYVLEVIDALLGPAGRRLEHQIVDERALASSVDSYYLELTDVGLWAMQAGTRPERVEEVLDLARRQIQALRESDVDEAALAEAKAYIRGSRLLNREESVDLAEELADGTVLGYYEPIDDYLAKIDRVTADGVKRVARDHLDPGRFSLVVLEP